MATSQPDIAFTVQARDAASRVFDKISKSSSFLGGQWTRLIALIGRLNIAFLALSVALPIVAAAFASLITVTTAISFVNFERGMRRTRIQMQLLGISAVAARDQVRTLAGMMDRAAATSFFISAEAINTVAIAGFELTKQLIPMSLEFAELTGLDPSKVFVALFDAFAKHDGAKFAELVLGVTDLAIPISVLAALEAGDVQPLIDLLKSFSSTEAITGTEKIADNLQRIVDLTLPAREQIVEVASLIVNVLLESLAEQLERAKDSLSLALKAAFIVAVFSSGTFLGGRLAQGLLVGLTVILISNLSGIVSDAIENPVVVSGILLTAFAVGQKIGGMKGGLVGGIILAIGLELLPGLITLFDDMSTGQQVAIMGLVLGTAIGLSLRLSILQSLALGFLLQTAANDLASNDSLTHKGMRVAFLVLGAAIGFTLGGPMGAVIGASLAQVAIDLLGDEDFMQKFTDVAVRISQTINETIINGLAEIPGALVNVMVLALNDIIKVINSIPLLPNTPLIPLVPGVSNVSTSFLNQGGTTPILTPSDFTIPTTMVAPTLGPMIPPTGLTVEDPLLFDEGGVVPGPLGAPRAAIVHGGEMVLPGGIMIIQLVLDKRVIEEISVNAINRTARFNAGMVPGAIGS